MSPSFYCVSQAILIVPDHCDVATVFSLILYTFFLHFASAWHAHRLAADRPLTVLKRGLSMAFSFLSSIRGKTKWFKFLCSEGYLPLLEAISCNASEKLRKIQTVKARETNGHFLRCSRNQWPFSFLSYSATEHHHRSIVHIRGKLPQLKNQEILAALSLPEWLAK